MLDQEVRNYTYMKKINIIWGVNLVLFVSVVFLGIQQAGKAADISGLEDKLEIVNIQKRDLAENIFKSGSDTKLTDNVSELGFVKPSKVYYFNSIDSVASLK